MMDLEQIRADIDAAEARAEALLAKSLRTAMLSCFFAGCGAAFWIAGFAEWLS